MRRVFVIAFMLMASPAFGQLYSGLIDPARATTNWTTAGATIKTAGHTCVTELTSVTLSTLNSDINTCSGTSSSSNVGLVVLPAATYNFAGAVVMKSNVILRGAGMSTILNLTSNTGSNWLAAFGVSVSFVGGFTAWADGAPPLVGTGGNAVVWDGTNGSTGTFTQGATVLNMHTTPTGLASGDMLVCYQSDAADAGLPNSGFFFSAKNGTGTDVSQVGTYYDTGDGAKASMEQRSMVTNVSGTQVTIAEGLDHPAGTWAAGLNPKCGWLKSSDLIQNSGLENLIVDSTGNHSQQDALIGMFFANNCWVKGVGLKPYYTFFHGSGFGSPSMNFVFVANDSVHVTVRDSWFDRAAGGGSSTTTYGAVFQETFASLIENNIFNNTEAPGAMTIGTIGDVITFNYENWVNDDQQEGGIQPHDPASSMSLVEGNRYRKLWADNLHGNTALLTFFRNHTSAGGMDLNSYNRWYNLIGNALNSATAYKSCYSDGTTYDRFSSVTFRLGYAGSSNSAGADSTFHPPSVVQPDALVCTSTMIWGNYDAFDSTSHFDNGDVPSGDAVFPNAIPSSHTLPASLLYTVSPSWWPGGVLWPLMGPDVTGGTYLSGHARKTPAQVCFEAAGGVDGAYSSTVISSFDPGCYNGAGAGQGGASASTAVLFGQVLLIWLLILIVGAPPSVRVPLAKIPEMVHEYVLGNH
jgi:hypothetical protein